MASLNSRITDLSALIYNNLVALGVVNVPQSQITTWVQDYYTGLLAQTPTLSTVQPDYELLLNQLETIVQSSNAWTDTLTAGTGEILLGVNAAMGAYSQFSIERALQETMSDTAVNDSSNYTIARMLGVHITRNTPANVTVTLNNANPLVPVLIPAYSQFSVGGVDYFNRQSIYFDGTTATESIPNVVLYQGTVVVNNAITSTGISSQTYTFGAQDFSTSDVDVVVEVNGVTWTSTQVGLWQYKYNDQVYYENTLPTGDVQIVFGDNIYGASPNNGDQIVITYVVTTGESANNSSAGQTVSTDLYSQITGVAITASLDGANAINASFYKAFNPFLYNAQNRLNTKDDFRAASLTYHGVRDILFLAQSDMPSITLSNMNVVEVIIVTDVPWGTSQWNKFVLWLKSRCAPNIQFIQINATAVPITINATVYCNNNSDLVAQKSLVQNALTSYFQPQPNCIGYSVFLNDIEDTIKDASSDIHYSVLTGLTDTQVTSYQYVTLAAVNITMAYSTRASKVQL